MSKKQIAPASVIYGPTTPVATHTQYWGCWEEKLLYWHHDRDRIIVYFPTREVAQLQVDLLNMASKNNINPSQFIAKRIGEA